MLRIKKIIPISLVFLLLSQSSSKASWFIDDAYSTMEMRRLANQLFISAPAYFGITVDEITSTPQNSGLTETPTALSKYAVLIDGVVDKIISWDGYSPNEAIDRDGVVVVKLPEGDGVKYVDENGIIRIASINHTDIVSEQVSPTQKVVPNLESTESVTVVIAPPPSAVAVAKENAPVVQSLNVTLNNSVTMVVAVPVVDPTTSTVAIQVVTDGRSGTSIGVAQGQTTVTVTELPQNQNVSVSAVITNTVTNLVEVVTIPVVATPVAPIIVATPIRDSNADKANIAPPVIQNVYINAVTGHKDADILVPTIANFDPSKTRVSLNLLGRNGAGVTVGLDGSSSVITVGWLAPTVSYSVKIIIIDLATGGKTTISGNDIP